MSTERGIETTLFICLSVVDTVIVLFLSVFPLFSFFKPKHSASRIARPLKVGMTGFRLIFHVSVTTAAVLLYLQVIPFEKSHTVFTSGIIAKVIGEWFTQADLIGESPWNSVRNLPCLGFVPFVTPQAVDFGRQRDWSEVVLIVTCALHRVLIPLIPPYYSSFHAPIGTKISIFRNSSKTQLRLAANIVGALTGIPGAFIGPLRCRLLLGFILSLFMFGSEVWVEIKRRILEPNHAMISLGHGESAKDIVSFTDML